MGQFFPARRQALFLRYHFPAYMLLISVLIGRPHKQTSVALNSPNENPPAMQPVVKFFDHLFLPRNAILARYMLMLWTSVCLSVRPSQTAVLYQNSQT